METPPDSPSRKSFLNRSVLLNVLFVFEGGINFLLDVVVAAGLGLGVQSDGLYAAWSIPQTIGRGMFQSLTNSFMGLFADEQEPAQAYNQAITVIAVTALPLAALLSATSYWWIPATIPGAGTETRAAAQSLAVILSWLVGFLALAETFRAIYYREGQVNFPSFARLGGAVVTILVVLVGALQQQLVLVAWGIVIGAAFEAVLGFAGLRWQLKLHYRFSWPDRQELAEIRDMVGVPLAGQGIGVLAGVVERTFASTLPPGTITAVSYANRIVSSLERFVFRGFVIATIQTFSAEIKSRLASRFRLVILISLPMAIILGLLTEPLIDVLFGRGRFSAADVELLALVLQAYALSIIGIGLTRIPFGLAYAQRQSRALLGYFAVVSGTLIISEYTLLRLGAGLSAFGWGYTLSVTAAFVWLYYTVIVPRYNTILSGRNVLQMLGVAVTASVGTWMFLQVLPAQWPLVDLIAGSLTALLLPAVLARLLHVDEYRQLLEFVKELRK